MSTKKLLPTRSSSCSDTAPTSATCTEGSVATGGATSTNSLSFGPTTRKARLVVSKLVGDPPSAHASFSEIGQPVGSERKRKRLAEAQAGAAVLATVSLLSAFAEPQAAREAMIVIAATAKVAR
jgi:hypothetical protein